MTTIFKKAAALFALVAVVLAGVVAATPAYAVGAGKLTVTSSDAGLNGAKVDAWKMFDAKKSGDSTYTFTVVEGWKGFFEQAGEGYPGFSATDPDFNAKAADYVRNLGQNNSADVTAFAKKAAAWAKANGNPGQVTAATAAKSDNQYVATFDGLELGYYLVKPYASVDTSTRGTDAMLISVVDANASIDLKNSYPTVEKKVDTDKKGNGAQVGDKVTFTLTSKVPNTSEFDKYTFQLVDTLSEGLTFNDDSNIVVKVGTTTLTRATNEVTGDYTLTQDGQTVTFDLSGKIKDLTAGEVITVTYTATLNEKAVQNFQDGKQDNTNSAKVVYTNGPSENNKGESTPSETHTYTFGFDLKKVDGDSNELAGAKFQLQRKGANGQYSIVKLVAVTSDGITSYRPAKSDTETSATDTVTTPADGIIKFTGLDDGAYKLVETEAPKDYNKAADTEFTIKANYNEDGTLGTWSIDKVTDGTMTIVNRKGTLLPSTGGMGTIVFTVAGAAVVIAGVAWTIARRRAQN